MTQPTLLQWAVLRAIVAHLLRMGRPPSLREIGDRLNISSTASVKWHLDALERHGLIKRDERIARGLRLTARGQKAVAQ